jgi:hypothetical protein
MKRKENKYNAYLSILETGVRDMGSVHGSYLGEPLGDYPPSECSLSTYSTNLRAYYGELKKGGIVVDKYPVDPEVAIDLVLNGPMVKLTLRDDEEECLKLDKISDAFIFGLEGGFQTLMAKKITTPSWRGLDYVSPRQYVQMWREVGARIGTRVRNHIEWEDGTRENIPKYADRWVQP